MQGFNIFRFTKQSTKMKYNLFKFSFVLWLMLFSFGVTAQKPVYYSEPEITYRKAMDLYTQKIYGPAGKLFEDYIKQIDDDDNIAYDEETSMWDFRENLKYCESSGYYTSSDEYLYVDYGTWADSYEHMDDVVMTMDEGIVHIDDATYIEDEDKYVYSTDGFYEHANCSWYSYEEEEDEDEVA